MITFTRRFVNFLLVTLLSSLLRTSPVCARAIEHEPLTGEAWMRFFTGKWKNQLGSTVSLKAGPDGILTGTYTTAVSSNGTSLTEPVHGSYRPCEDETKATVALNVQWQYRDAEGGSHESVAVWATVADWNDGFEPKEIRFSTIWLLASADAPKWRSIATNQDDFVKLS